MSTTTSQDQPKAASSLSHPVITRIDKRFVQIKTGTGTKIVFAPISPDIKLFDPPEKPATTPPATRPPAIASKPVVAPPLASPTKPAAAKPSPIQTPVNVKPDIAPPPITSKPASNKPVSGDVPASLQKPVTPDKSISLDKPASLPTASPAKPAVTPALAPVSPTPVVTPPSAHASPPAPVSSKPAAAAPAPVPLQVPTPASLKPATPEKLPAPTTMPAQRDKIDGKDVLVYGNPKSYVDLDYAQGNAVPGYMGSFADARQDNLWFSKTGQDLRIKVLGTTDQVTVKDWYAGAAGTTDNHIERIKTADGKSLLDTDVDKLVQAMASFAPPAATQTTWAQAQGGDGKVLLAVSH
ncbi:calcium-binding protein [Herbaspirillum sp. 1130]|uniref:calcium-binding protein n=1 Tax=Herbaspirillum sp. 1130 TaxID=2806562 RepID=UPI001B783123|nr:hypothetical protein [Herbaspirillum sp. 1130]